MDAGQHFLHAEFALQAILFPGNLPELNEEACQLAHLLHHALPNSYWFRRLTSPQTVVAISDVLNYAVCSAYITRFTDAEPAKNVAFLSMVMARSFGWQCSLRHHLHFEAPRNVEL